MEAQMLQMGADLARCRELVSTSHTDKETRICTLMHVNIHILRAYSTSRTTGVHIGGTVGCAKPTCQATARARETPKPPFEFGVSKQVISRVSQLFQLQVTNIKFAYNPNHTIFQNLDKLVEFHMHWITHTNSQAERISTQDFTIQQLQAAVQTAQLQNRELQASVQIKHNEADTTAHANIRLRQELEACNQHRGAQETIVAENRKLKSELLEVKTKLDINRKFLKTKEIELKTARDTISQCEQHNNEYTPLQAQLEQLNSHVITQQQELEKAQQNADNKEQQIDQLKSQLDDQKNIISTKKQELVAFKNKYNAENKRYTEFVTNQNNTHARTVNEKDEYIATLKETEERTKEQLQLVEHKNKVIENALQECHNHNDAARILNEEVQAHNAKLTQELNGLYNTMFEEGDHALVDMAAYSIENMLNWIQTQKATLGIIEEVSNAVTQDKDNYMDKDGSDPYDIQVHELIYKVQNELLQHLKNTSGDTKQIVHYTSIPQKLANEFLAWHQARVSESTQKNDRFIRQIQSKVEQLYKAYMSVYPEHRMNENVKPDEKLLKVITLTNYTVQILLNVTELAHLTPSTATNGIIDIAANIKQTIIKTVCSMLIGSQFKQRASDLLNNIDNVFRQQISAFTFETPGNSDRGTLFALQVFFPIVQTLFSGKFEQYIAILSRFFSKIDNEIYFSPIATFTGNSCCVSP